MATWSGFSDAEVSKIKVKLQSAPKRNTCNPNLKEERFQQTRNVEEVGSGDKDKNKGSGLVDSETIETEDSVLAPHTHATDDESKGFGEER